MTSEAGYDLDVASPEQVADVLRHAADRYAESASELRSAWQDPKAGRVWSKIATILNRVANQIDTLVEND